MRFFSGAQKNTVGMTLLEITMVMGILAVLALAGFGSYYGLRLSVDIEEEENRMAGALNEARGRAIAVDQGYAWGVRFDNTVSTAPFYALFTGPSYAGSSTTTVYYLSDKLSFLTPAAGSASEVVFTKRTGTTTAAATITIHLKEDASVSKTLTVSADGLVQK